MKFFLLAILILIITVSFSVSADKVHSFAGVKKCKMCHKGEKKGQMFEIWQGSSHSKAYETLGGDVAKATYAKLGKEGDPQQDPDCLKCHVTGYGLDSLVTQKIDPANGVSCEACHGAGGDYFKKTVMVDHVMAVENGLVEKPSEGCVKCHNEESPTFKTFDFAKHWEKIKHEVPAK